MEFTAGGTSNAGNRFTAWTSSKIDSEQGDTYCLAAKDKFDPLDF
jgi:hypothetical protein